MANNSAKLHRRSIRLKGFDYSSPRLYFVTFCIQHRVHLFGEIEDGEMILNEAGTMIEREWEKLPERFPQLELHEFRVMPNHFHGIIEITKPKDINLPNECISEPPPVRAPLVGAPSNAENMARSNADLFNAGIILPLDDNSRAPINASAPALESEIKKNAPLARDGAPTRDAHTEEGNSEESAKNNLTLGEIMGAFKSITTVEYIKGVKNIGWQPFEGKLWHRDYWEHIIKSRYAYGKISDYIVNNPARWKEDKFFK